MQLKGDLVIIVQLLLSFSIKSIIDDLIFFIKDSATAFKVASRINELVDEEVQLVTQSLDHKELSQLQSSFQVSSRGLITGGMKAIKDLEKNQFKFLN